MILYSSEAPVVERLKAYEVMKWLWDTGTAYPRLVFPWAVFYLWLAP